MKQIKFKITKDMITKVREDFSLVLYNIKGFGIKELELFNTVLRGLENAKFNISFN